MYTIGRLARRAKVNADTIRFYEREGLLAPSSKTAAGYRLYNEDALRRIAFIKHAQRCGFSLADVSALLGIGSADGLARGNAYRLAADKQVDIRKSIETLCAMSAALARVLESRSLDGPARVDPETALVTALEANLAQVGDRSVADRPRQWAAA